MAGDIKGLKKVSEYEWVFMTEKQLFISEILAFCSQQVLPTCGPTQSNSDIQCLHNNVKMARLFYSFIFKISVLMKQFGAVRHAGNQSCSSCCHVYL